VPPIRQTHAIQALMRSVLKDALLVATGQGALSRRHLVRAATAAAEGLLASASIDLSIADVRATVGSWGTDPKGADRLANALAALGTTGIVAVQSTRRRGVSIDAVEALTFPLDQVAPAIPGRASEMQDPWVLDRPAVAIFGANIDLSDMESLLGPRLDGDEPIVLVTASADPELVQELGIWGAQHANVYPVAVVAGGQQGRAILQDIMGLTGARVMGHEVSTQGARLRQSLGMAGQVTVGLTDATFVGAPASYSQRLGTSFSAARHPALLVDIGRVREARSLDHPKQFEQALDGVLEALSGVVMARGPALRGARLALSRLSEGGDRRDRVAASVVNKMLDGISRELPPSRHSVKVPMLLPASLIASELIHATKSAPLPETLRPNLPPPPPSQPPPPSAARTNGNGDPPRRPGLHRVASADFPAVVEPASDNILSYAIAEQPIYDHSVQLTIAPQLTTGFLVVMVDTNDFIVRDVDTGKTTNFDRIPLKALLNDTPLYGRFQLTAKDVSGPLETVIYLRFTYRRQPVGRIALKVVVAEAQSSSPSGNGSVSSSITIKGDRPKDADIVIYVTARSDDRFAIKVAGTTRHRKQILGRPLGEFPVEGNAWKYARSILDQFRQARTLDPSHRNIRVNGLGYNLWSKLPLLFQNFYWDELHGRDLSIVISSEEPYIPWELVKPRGPEGQGAEMFGVSFAMARWEQEVDLPSPLSVSGFAVVAPDYAKADLIRGWPELPSSAAEAEDMVRLFGAREVPGYVADVTTLLQSANVQAIHFSGHGRFDPDSVANSEIALIDGSLIPSDIQGIADSQPLPGQPLVFVNACEVGDQDWALTQIGGWASEFCGAGCTAFIGPYWAVNDAVARKAAMVFYGQLREIDTRGRSAKTVGQAMQALRRRFWSDDEYRFHPTWLAYTLHCHPNVTVRLP
jgi:hypothetical protein